MGGEEVVRFHWRLHSDICGSFFGTKDHPALSFTVLN